MKYGLEIQHPPGAPWSLVKDTQGVLTFDTPEEANSLVRLALLYFQEIDAKRVRVVPVSVTQ
jgi:hypothetical protein